MTPAGAIMTQAAVTKAQVSSIQRTGVNPASNIPADTQRSARIGNYVAALPKGRQFSVYVVNNHATDDQNFLMFDVCGIAAARGASANGANIAYTTTFAGTGSAAGYTALKEALKGIHVGVLGTSFNFSAEAIIDTSNINIWNGNFQNYNSLSLQDYFNLANDNYSNDQKRLNMETELYLNPFLALSGVLPAGGSINILFSVAAVSNF